MERAIRLDAQVSWNHKTQAPRLMNTTQAPAPLRDNSAAWTLIFCAWLVASVSTLGALLKTLVDEALISTR